jgi:hypothetical protein
VRAHLPGVAPEPLTGWGTPLEAFLALWSTTMLLVSFVNSSPELPCVAGIRPRGHFILQSFSLACFFDKTEG